MLGRICTKPVVTVAATATVAHAARAMRTRNVGTVVVVNARRPIGLVTDRDIATEVVAHGKDPESVPVGKVMRRKPAVIRAEAGVLDAAQMFARTGVRRLPVVAKDGTLLGIITMDDILILLGNEMGHISAALAAGLRRAS